MKRRALALLLVVAAGAGAYVWLRGRRSRASRAAARRQQQALIEMYQRLPAPARQRADQFISARNPAWRQQLEEFSSGRQNELSASMEFSIQVAVVPELKPVPIVNGRLMPVLPQREMPQAPPLTPERQRVILHAAESVGRLELKTGVEYRLQGTGFVVAPGLVATNCHVVKGFSQRASAGAPFALAPGDLRIDFGDTPAHQESREHRILGLKPCPGEGLDVAFLEVSARSVDGQRVLPDPLPLTPVTPRPLASGESLNVGEIGYPDLNHLDLIEGATQDLFRSFDANRYAKFYSPGAITTVRPASGIDFISHIVATWPGESGSPLLDAGGQSVVAIDSCCDAVGGPLPDPSEMSCATRLLPVKSNLGIGSWSVVRDQVLGPMLLRDLTGLPTR